MWRVEGILARMELSEGIKRTGGGSILHGGTSY